jgi:hypothetical protein
MATQPAIVDVPPACTMRCTIVEPTKVSAMLTFVVKSPQIPGTPTGNVEII